MPKGKKMIDFHTHILPCIDDGARSLDESLALLQMLEEQGVDTVVFTPHYYGRKKGAEQFLVKREESFRSLLQAYNGPVRLLRGCECNIQTCANTDMSALRPLVLEGTRYILTELSFAPQWSEKELFLSRLKELKESVGLTPVIAHAELYPALQKHPNWATRLIAMGCLLQINCESVVRAGKNSLVQALVLHGQAHCLGSDTHNIDRRPPFYREAAARLNEWSAAAAAGIQQTMRDIVAGEPVRARAGEAVKRKLFGYA